MGRNASQLVGLKSESELACAEMYAEHRHSFSLLPTTTLFMSMRRTLTMQLASVAWPDTACFKAWPLGAVITLESNESRQDNRPPVEAYVRPSICALLH